MKTYFIQFDFYDGGVLKYLSSLITIDIRVDPMMDSCRDLIREHHPEIDADEVNIKINAFNLV